MWRTPWAGSSPSGKLNQDGLSFEVDTKTGVLSIIGENDR